MPSTVQSREDAARSISVGRVMLDAPAADAVAGQVGRGRVVSARVMHWHNTRWSRLLGAADSGALAEEGWNQIVVLDRAHSSQVEDLGELVHGRS